MENLNDLRCLTRDAARYRIFKEIIKSTGLLVGCETNGIISLKTPEEVESYIDKEIAKLWE